MSQAQALVQFMWDARPPLNPTQLARRAGIRKQLLSSWLQSPSHAVISPEPAVVVRLARAMGRPVNDLFLAAGHTDPGDPLFDLPGAWEYVMARVDYALTFSHARDDAEEDAAMREDAAGFEQATALRELLQPLREDDLGHWTGGSTGHDAASARAESGHQGEPHVQRRSPAAGGASDATEQSPPSG
jgi:transcriptional regulator with XRE-family HTH domain